MDTADPDKSDNKQVFFSLLEVTVNSLLAGGGVRLNQGQTVRLMMVEAHLSGKSDR